MAKRTAKKISFDEFKKIFNREIAALLEYSSGIIDSDVLKSVCIDNKKILKDISKIEFGFEYLDSDPNGPSGEGKYAQDGDPVGFQTLPNGLSYFGILAGGDCGYPVYFILYFDGNCLRGYIPEEGNVFNSLLKTAYGSRIENDIEDIKKKFPDLFNEALLEFSKEMYSKNYEDLDDIKRSRVDEEICQSILDGCGCEFDWELIAKDIQERIEFQDIPINPRIEERPDWDTYFVALCEILKTRSLDPNTQVGSVIVDKRNRIVATGYNSYPPNCKDEELPYGREGENSKYPWMVHAEMNAIVSCGRELLDCTVYVPFMPCPDCFKAIITSGIKCVKYYGTYESGVNKDDLVKKMAKISGVELEKIEVKKPAIHW